MGKTIQYQEYFFFIVIPKIKIKGTVKNKLLAQEEIKYVPFYIDNYINTYMQDEESVYDNRNCQNDKSFSKE